MAQTYDDAKAYQVLYSVGKFKNDSRTKFLRAPFDVVQISGQTYVQPLSIGLSRSASDQAGATDLEQARMFRQLWYYEGTPIIMEEHQMGDKSDNWMGLQKFGLV